MHQPFDRLAATYDRDFSDTAIGTWLRARTHDWLDARFEPGDHVLELGCGTGLDALHLAQRGVYVTATDASAEMLAQAQARWAGHTQVMGQSLDLRALSGEALPGPFDGAFASFGPLNVLSDARPLAAWLGTRVRPGGVLMLGMMGPLCLWEIAWHSLHGDLPTAFRRLRGPATFQQSGGPAMAVYYPSPRRLAQSFVPWFRMLSLRGLGAFLPPSDAFGAVERRSRLLRMLTALEQRLAANPIAAHVADHYWITFERLP